MRPEPRASSQSLRQCLALDEFEDERAYTAALLKAVDSGDVGMIQRREDLRFALESRQTLGISGEQIRQDFDRHVALQACIAGPRILLSGSEDRGR